MKETPAKTWYAEKASFARYRVCQRCQRSMLHAILQGCMNLIYKPIYKVTFKKFICHVRGDEGSVHIHE